MAAATHRLKTLPGLFEAMMHGYLKVLYRKDDRGFTVGDFLHLQEHQFLEAHQKHWYSGRELKVLVTYILRGPDFGIPEGYVVMSIEPILESPFPLPVSEEEEEKGGGV